MFFPGGLMIHQWLTFQPYVIWRFPEMGIRGTPEWMVYNGNPVELLALMILGNTYFNTFNKIYHI